MVKVFETNYGTLKVDFNPYTENAIISINDISAVKISKKTFEIIDISFNEGQELTIKLIGNIFKGIIVDIEGETYRVTDAISWYEYIISIGLTALTIAWGNIVGLVKILPLVGGAIGGLTAGFGFVLGLALSRLTNNRLLRIFIIIGFCALAFLGCLLLGLTIVGLLKR